MKATLDWIQGMQFRCDNHGIITQLDAAPEHGGDDSAPNPKELVLNAMMGCTAMDVVSILKKMRQVIGTFKMNIEAQKTTHHPTHFSSALMTYELTGELDGDKVIKAVDSSMTKYCGVNYMMSKTCDIEYRVLLNGEEIHRTKADFEVPPAE